MIMTEVVLTITITIQIPEPPLRPAPTAAKGLEPVFTNEQPPMCRCKVRYGTKAA